MSKKRNTPPALVTRESLRDMLAQADDAKKIRIIGRALVALFERQTEDEKVSDATNNHNGVGFTSCHARPGSLSAKSFIKRGTLATWQVELWTRTAKNGFPRICMYARQLNEIAIRKAESTKPAVPATAPQPERRLAELRAAYAECVDSDDPSILTPIVMEMRELENQLEVEHYRIFGAVV